MKRLLNVRKLCLWTVLGATSLALTIGTTCPVTGDNTRPVVPPGNRPPRIIITSVTTAFGNNFAEVGESVSIAFSGEDAEDAAVARVFASTSGNPTPAEEIPILGGFPIGPGTGNGVAVWDTTGFAAGGYNIFAEIDDRTLDPFTGTGNPPVRVTFSSALQLGNPGSRPATSAPQLVFLSPTVNLGLSAQDELTLRYIYADVDSTATITLLLDKDLISTNDDINNPGDPTDPASNIIILPSFPREPMIPYLMVTSSTIPTIRLTSRTAWKSAQIHASWRRRSPANFLSSEPRWPVRSLNTSSQSTLPRFRQERNRISSAQPSLTETIPGTSTRPED